MDTENNSSEEVEGILDISSKNNYARLFRPDRSDAAHRDTYVPQSFLQKLRIRSGQYIHGLAVRDSDDKPLRLIRVNLVDGLPLATRRNCLPFSSATTTFPSRRLRLEMGPDCLINRVIDLFVPLGRGQRALVVAPPRTGKTTVLQSIARGITENEPDCHLMVLLVDERPEEVTEFRRSIAGEIFASSNDESLSRHVHVAQLAFQRAQNLVETGKDVVLLLDSLTRLARAYNNLSGHGGRTMTGGLDSQALERPRQLFSMARNTEELGSLTIVASALIETGSRMDDLIFQEFKGTGNAEIVLDRRIAERRIFPAINLAASGTRREELLLTDEERKACQFLRRAIDSSRPEEATENLLARLQKTPDNGSFIRFLTKFQ